MKKIILCALFIALPACSQILGQGCIARKGDCFDAAIEGQKVVYMSDSSALRKYYRPGMEAWLKADLDQAKWTVPDPLAGELRTEVTPNSRGSSWFGTNPSAEVQVVPLNRQKISSTPTLKTSDNVYIEKGAAIQQRNVINQNKLPSGDYLLRIRAAGSANWDRKTVFITVR